MNKLTNTITHLELNNQGQIIALKGKCKAKELQTKQEATEQIPNYCNNQNECQKEAYFWYQQYQKAEHDKQRLEQRLRILQTYKKR